MECPRLIGVCMMSWKQIKVGDLVSPSNNIERAGLVINIVDGDSGIMAGMIVTDLRRPSVYAIARVKWLDCSNIDELYLVDLRKIKCKSTVTS